MRIMPVMRGMLGMLSPKSGQFWRKRGKHSVFKVLGRRTRPNSIFGRIFGDPSKKLCFHWFCLDSRLGANVESLETCSAGRAQLSPPNPISGRGFGEQIEKAKRF